MSNTNKEDCRALILQAREGDEKSLGTLISMYEPLIRSLLSKYSSDGMSREDSEDMRQEALIIFCNAVMKYNLEQEDVEFGLYAKICIERAMVSLLRSFAKRPLIEPIDDEAPALSEEEDPSLKIIESENICELLRLIDENLSEYEGRVWNLHLSGHTSQEISELLSREVKSIDNALCRIRAKLRRALKRQ